MEFSALQIAGFLRGTIEGDPNVLVSSFSKIEEGKPGTLSFLSNPKYNQYIYDTEASIVLVNNSFEAEKPLKATLIRVENAYESLALLLNLVEQSKPQKTGISQQAYISESAIIGENAYIEPFVHISDGVVIGKNVRIFSNTHVGENVKIGDNVVLFSGVHIYHDCVLGNDCKLHSGVVIGSDGFGFAKSNDGVYNKIPQTGNVILEDDVEIGANTTIDRATFGSTFIRKGVKIDNLVQIAHNVEVGENTVIASQTGISGSTKLGKNCILAGQVGLAGHLNIADGTIFGAQAGVANSIKVPGQIWQGSPAVSLKTFHKSSIVIKNLPDIQRIVYDLQRRIVELEKQNEKG